MIYETGSETLNMDKSTERNTNPKTQEFKNSISKGVESRKHEETEKILRKGTK